MNILLTGSSGFIGRELLKRLTVKLGHNVHTIDVADSADQDLMYCTLPKENKINLVIHLAGKSGVRESIKDPASYWLNNIEASRRLFNSYPNTRILYASSSSAYEPDLNPYAASKYCLEELAERYPNTLGMRFHTVYADVCPRKNMFFQRLRNDTLEYVTRHYRDFVHLQDVLDAIELLIAKPKVNGTIDIGTGIPVRIQDLAPDLPIRLNTPGEREYTCANTEKIKGLGWKPKYFIENFLTKEDKGNIINITNGEPL
jgi:nucleoside-diphosphate-sugar epimerase|tara:strand:- start:3890 stop:4663 length:774 start_codon:yes stop_codon:yes gene_type:complete